MKKYKRFLLGLFFILIVSGIVFLIFQGKNTTLDIYSAFVQDLYCNISPNKNAYILKQFYDSNGISNDYKINIGILNIVHKNDPGILDALDVEQGVKELLGEDATITHETIQFFINDHCGYTYEATDKKYIPFDGCGGIPDEYIYQKLLSAQKVGDKIILQEQILDIFKDLNSNEVFVYNNVEHEKLIDTIQEYEGIVTEIDDSKYIDAGSVYEYIFRKEKDHYVLESLKKVG